MRSYCWTVPHARAGVLLVHGFGDHAGRYGDLVRILGSRGYSVFAYDQRGHGASEGTRGHADRFELFLEDLDAAWTATGRTAPGPLFLYGHSFGGLVATRWLQTRSERPAGVVLSAPWLGTAFDVPLWKRVVARVLLRLAPSLAVQSGSNDPERLTRDPERMAAYGSDALVHHVISARFHAEALRAQKEAIARALPADVPALLVVPRADPLVDTQVSLRWVREHGDQIEVRVREEGLHELHNDLDRNAALSGVADWLDGCGGPNP